MDEELSMLLKTVIPLAAVILGLLVLYWLLPLWLFATVVVVGLGVAASPKARAAIKKALQPPPDVETDATAADSADKK